jgi:hypothetical protein
VQRAWSNDWLWGKTLVEAPETGKYLMILSFQ